jgi:HK97 family phage prohead protease
MMPQIQTRQTAAPPPGDDPLEFVMSDGSVDRMGDIIDPAGWLLDNFRKNPVALFGHQSGFPIGKWSEVVIKDDRLVGRLELMAPVSDRLRELHTAVAAGVLRAVSVGFHPKKMEPIEDSTEGGYRFLEQELVECSLVAVPANPNALAVAKALGISSQGQQLIFGVPADQAARSSGVPAGNQLVLRKQSPMNQLSERIQTAQSEVVAMQDQLGGLIECDDLTNSAELTDRIERTQAQLAIWERAERALGNTSEVIPLTPAARPGVTNLPAVLQARPKGWPQPKKKDEEPGYLFLRHCVVQVKAHISKKPIEQVLAETYGHYGDFEVTREVHNWYTRAATAPATMTTVGWAAELAQIQYGEFFDILIPGSIYAPLSGHGFRATLGRFAQLSLPTRTVTPTVSGSFVGEGSPIPVRQAQTAAVVINLKKMAVIVSYTREIAEHSTPQIEGLLRQFIAEDTQVAIDTVLVDANPATAIRPAGLRSGVVGLTATAGGGFAALIGDIKQMISVLAAANALRTPVWIMHPSQATSISLTATANGVFPFKMEIDAKMLQGYPTIISSTIPVGTVILLDAADFVTVTGDEPRFEVSDQATLHFDDTTPLQISTPGAPNVVAAPVRSMFQTDSLALRMIMPMNWIMRRAGVVAWISGVTW